MRDVKIKDESFKKGSFDMGDHIKKCFKMYPGEVGLVEIKFDNKLINVVIDRFGSDVTLWKADDNYFIIRVEAAVNEGLVRWILTWGSHAKVLYPGDLAHKVKIECQKMYNLYR